MTTRISDLDQRGLSQSLWLATAEPAPDCPALVGEIACDVLVVGAGFAGLSTALHLAEKGVDVVVLEAAQPGFGASGRNGGQVISGLKDGLAPMLQRRFGQERAERIYDFADTTADAVFDLIERHNITCAAERNGWLQGAHAATAARRLEQKARDRATRGHDVTYLDEAETARLSGSEWYKGAFLDRRGGQLQPLSYARGLARAAQGLGVRIHGSSPVETLERVANQWHARTPGGMVKASSVVLCTNGYTALSNYMPALSKTVVPFFSYQVATGPLGENRRQGILPEGHCVSDTRRVLAYYRFDHEGRFLMGARGRIDGSLSDDSFDRARERIRQLLPSLADEPLEYFWNGRVAVTNDHFPLVMEPAPGLFAAMGWNGRGVAITTAMGRVMAERVTGTPAVDLPIPETPVRSIPFHGLRFFGAWALARWMDWQDRRDRASGV